MKSMLSILFKDNRRHSSNRRANRGLEFEALESRTLLTGLNTVPLNTFGQPVGTTPVNTFDQPVTNTKPVDTTGQVVTNTTPLNSLGQPVTNKAPLNTFGQPVTNTTPLNSLGQPVTNTTPVNSLGQAVTNTTALNTFLQPVTTDVGGGHFGLVSTPVNPILSSSAVDTVLSASQQQILQNDGVGSVTTMGGLYQLGETANSSSPTLADGTTNAWQDPNNPGGPESVWNLPANVVRGVMNLVDSPLFPVLYPEAGAPIAAVKAGVAIVNAATGQQQDSGGYQTQWQVQQNNLQQQYQNYGNQNSNGR